MTHRYDTRRPLSVISDILTLGVMAALTATGVSAAAATAFMASADTPHEVLPTVVVVGKKAEVVKLPTVYVVGKRSTSAT